MQTVFSSVRPSIPPESRVMTPLGGGILMGWTADLTQYLICFRKKDYPKEEWFNFSKGNGPCVFRMIPASSITQETGNIIKHQFKGQTWENKSSGKRYLILSEGHDWVEIRSVDTGNKWRTTQKSLLSKFKRSETP